MGKTIVDEKDEPKEQNKKPLSEQKRLNGKYTRNDSRIQARRRKNKEAINTHGERKEMKPTNGNGKNERNRNVQVKAFSQTEEEEQQPKKPSTYVSPDTRTR